MAPAQRIFQILIPLLVPRTSSLSAFPSRALRAPMPLLLFLLLVPFFSVGLPGKPRGGSSGSGGLSDPLCSFLTSVGGRSSSSESSSSNSESSSDSSSRSPRRSGSTALAGDRGIGGRGSRRGDLEAWGRSARAFGVVPAARAEVPAGTHAREWSRLAKALQSLAADSRASSATDLIPCECQATRSNPWLCSRDEHPRHQVSPSCANPCLHLLQRGGMTPLGYA